MIKDPIVINAYWLSIVFIGYMIWAIIGHRSPSNALFVFFKRFGFLSKFLFSFASSVSIFSLASIFLYLGKLPAIYGVVLYITLITLAIMAGLYIYIPKLISANQKTTNSNGEVRLPVVKLTASLLIITIGVDLFISYVTRSNVGGDAIYHMSRVLNMVHEGFNTNTSFFSNIPDGSYHYNVIYALYVIGAKLFSLEPMRFWEMSLPFFRLLQWASIYTFARYVWSNWLSEKKNSQVLAAVTTISAVLLFSGKLFVATYPNQIVTAWITVYIISLMSFWASPKKLAIVLLPISLLTTMTHPMYALVVVVAVVYIGLIRLLRGIKRQNVDLKQVGVIIVSTMLLMLGPMVTHLTPMLASSNQISLGQDHIKHIGFLQYADPQLAVPDSLPLLMAAAALVVSFIYLSFKLWQRKSDWSMMVSMTTLPYIVLVFPPVFTILHQALPVWAILRFDGVNILMFVALPISVYAVVAGFRSLISTKKLLLWAVAVLTIALFGAKQAYEAFVKYTLPKQVTYAQNQEVASDLKKVLNSNDMVVIDEAYGYMVTSILDIDILSIEKGHFPVAADAVNRSLCMKHILGRFNSEDLKIIGAKFVLVPQSEAASTLYRVVPSKPYLELIAADKYYLVYKFTGSNLPDNPENRAVACKRYQQVESAGLR